MNGCTHLECTKTGERYESETLQTLSKAGAPLYARYDLSPVKEETLKLVVHVGSWQTAVNGLQNRCRFNSLRRGTTGHPQRFEQATGRAEPNAAKLTMPSAAVKIRS